MAPVPPLRGRSGRFHQLIVLLVVELLVLVLLVVLDVLVGGHLASLSMKPAVELSSQVHEATARPAGAVVCWAVRVPFQGVCGTLRLLVMRGLPAHFHLLVLVLLLVCSLLRVVCFFGFNVRLVALFLALFLLPMPFLQMCLVLRFLVLLFGGSLCLRVLLLALLSRCLLLAPVFVPFVHLLAALMPLFLADMAPVPPLRGRSGSVGLHHL